MSALSASHTMASEEKSCQASAISSAGSPTMITGLACSIATTRTARPTSCGRTRPANQRRHIVLAPAPAAGCGDTTVSWPFGSMNMMRTWRRCLSWSGNSSSSSESLPCAARSFMVAATKRWATSSEASISTLVAVRVLRIETAPASSAARRLIDPHSHEQLRADRPLVPKLLQHASIVSTLGLA